MGEGSRCDSCIARGSARILCSGQSRFERFFAPEIITQYRVNQRRGPRFFEASAGLDAFIDHGIIGNR